MPFPDSPRAIFRQNPLEEVICQVKFPPILRLEAEAPASFQQQIRDDYPLYEEGPAGQAAAGVPPEVLRLLTQGQIQRNFLSEDRVWTVSLTREFLALTASKYDRWETFRSHFKAPLTVFEEQYSPPFYSRIGLRYRNVIRRSRLGLEGAEWASLLEPHIAAELGSAGVGADVRQTAHQVTFALEHGAVAQVRHGLTQAGAQEPEQCYTIDADFYTTEKTERGDVDGIMDGFNEQARRLFAWCISARLREALHPEPVAVAR